MGTAMRQGILLGKALLDLLVPRRCPVCRQEIAEEEDRSFLCPSCLAETELRVEPLCPTCGRVLPSPQLLKATPRFLCGDCREEKPSVDGVHTILSFGGVVRDAIHRFKYGGHARLGRKMILSFPDAIREAGRAADIVVPVPLDRGRLRKRGFNQSVVLAREVSALLVRPLVLDALIRREGGRSQAGLTRKERRRNVRASFAVNRHDRIKGHSILIVDDVLTTGATANECARVLKAAGAGNVRLLALASAQPDAGP